MNLSRLLLSASLLLSLATYLLPQTASAQNTAAQRHTLSGTYINWSQSRSFTKLETDLKFISDPGQSSAWFLSHQFSLKDANGAGLGGGYIGLQTQVTTLGVKGIMFSIWNATAATAAPGATCTTFGGEGVGMQCFRAYPWVAGKTYRLRVTQTSTGFSGAVLDMSSTTPIVTALGEIQAPPGVAGFSTDSIQWAEHYGYAPANCSDFPYVKVLWGRPRGDDGAVLPGSPNNYYSTVGYCKNSAIVASGVDNTMEAGNPGVTTKQNLLSSASKYLIPVSAAEGCGGAGMRPDSATITRCTPLSRVVLAGGKIALQTENGYYLSCTGGGGSGVSASSRTVGNNETFTETKSGTSVTYKSYGGKYLTALNYGAVALNCNAYFASTNEKFTPVLNKARTATATASSETPAYDQLASKTIDGKVDGYPGNSALEWTTSEGVGAWIQLKWSATTAVKQVVLYDRINTNDQIMAGTLLFSDGSSLPVGALPNDGTGLPVSFASKNITWVKFRIDQATGLIGLAEFEVY